VDVAHDREPKTIGVDESLEVRPLANTLVHVTPPSAVASTPPVVRNLPAVTMARQFLLLEHDSRPEPGRDGVVDSVHVAPPSKL
jgi:hypothetical protein